MPPAPPPPPQQRRYAVLKAGHASPYNETTHGGYAQMIVRLLRDPDADERWDIFAVVDGDFSFLDAEFDGFVITGSPADAHADDDWVIRLRDAIRELHGKGKRFLGICFGHQILARAMGGSTGRAAVGWEIGLKTIRLNSEKIEEIFGVESPSAAAVHLFESHRDQVSVVPPGGVILATSEKTPIEMFAVGDRVLGIQGHPEFAEDIMMDIIRGRLAAKVFTHELANEAIESLEKVEPDQVFVKSLCQTFLKGNGKCSS